MNPSLPQAPTQESDLAEATQVARWVYWLCHAQEYEAARLRTRLPQEGFQQATQAIETIALKTEDKTMYDTSIKAERDRQASLEWAMKKGMEKGLEKGLMTGFIGRIQLCQSLLGRPETPSAELQVRSLAALQELAGQLEADLRNR